MLDGMVGETFEGVIENSRTVLAKGEIFCLIVSCLNESCGRVVSDVTTTGKGGVVTLGVTVGVGSKICSFVDVVRNVKIKIIPKIKPSAANPKIV